MFEFINNIPLIGGVLGVIVPFLIVLTVVVFIHEYGHYIIGRWSGIGAKTFSVGFGPVVASWTDRRDTKWQIAAIPLGGYVKFSGDQNPASTHQVDEENIPERAQFHLAPIWARMATVAAGPIFNFILAFFVFMALPFMSGIPDERIVIGDIHPELSNNFDLQSGDRIISIDGISMKGRGDFSKFVGIETPKLTMPYGLERNGQQIEVDGPFPFVPIVGSVMPVSPAMKSGLQEGDIILSLAGVPMQSFQQLRTLVPALEQKPYEMLILRGGAEQKLSITPYPRALPDGNGGFVERLAIGVVAGQSFSLALRTPSIGEAVNIGANSVVQVLSDSIDGIRQIVLGNIGIENLQGPVGIAHVASDVAKSGWLDLFSLIGFLSAAIGFLNLLPIPVLDGGHLVLYAYEGLTGRKPNPKIQHYATIGALSLLLTMMLFVTMNDVTRLWLFG